MGLLGLLEPADPVPVAAAEEVVHADAATVEVQAVRVVAVLGVST